MKERKITICTNVEFNLPNIEFNEQGSLPIKNLSNGYFEEAGRVFPLVPTLQLLYFTIESLNVSIYNDLKNIFPKTSDVETNERFLKAYIEISQRVYPLMLHREFQVQNLYHD